MTGDADSASSILELLSFLLTGYRRIRFASYGLRMSRIALKSLTVRIEPYVVLIWRHNDRHSVVHNSNRETAGFS